jgi:hypothetical protein
VVLALVEIDWLAMFVPGGFATAQNVFDYIPRDWMGRSL